MKGVAITIIAAGVVVVGGRSLADSYVGDRPGVKASAAGKSTDNGKCWSPDKIRGAGFSVRGIPGSIRSFKLDPAEGCTFRVEVELVAPAGNVRSLDYMATFAAGDRPIFLRYNTPPR